MANGSHVRRTKSGCLSCRYTKRKCDEKKPHCFICTKKSIPCIWPQHNDQSLAKFIDKSGKNCFNLVDLKRVTRSKDGCQQCKKSKKKCDEKKPICQRCLDYGNECSFLFDKSSKKAKELLLSSTTIPESTDLQENSADLIPTLVPKESEYSELVQPYSIEIANYQIPLINTFFDSVIKILMPDHMMQFMSEFIFNSATNCSFVNDSITSLTAAFVYKIDTSPQLLVKYPNYSENSTVTDRLYAIIFRVLISLYTDTSNEMVISNIQYGLYLALKFYPSKPSKEFTIILESLIYNYSVSIITSPKTLFIHNPFIVLEKMKAGFPPYPDRETAPFLGTTLETFIMLAKVSYVFKYPLLFDLMGSQLMDHINNMLLIQPMKMLSTDVVIPVFVTAYICLLSSKLLLLHLGKQELSIEYRSTVTEIQFVLEHAIYKSKKRIDSRRLWAMFIFGLNLQNKVDQVVLTDHFQQCLEQTKNIEYLRAIKKFNIAWEKNLGLDILRDQTFTTELILN